MVAGILRSVTFGVGIEQTVRLAVQCEAFAH
jgi:hypothetical protein